MITNKQYKEVLEEIGTDKNLDSVKAGLVRPLINNISTNDIPVKRTVFTGEITNAFMASNDDIGTIQKGDVLSDGLTEYRTNPLNKVYFMKNDLFDNTLSQPTKRLFLFNLSKLAQNVGQYETDINKIREGTAQPFNIKEYMDECGLKDRKEAIKAVRKSIKEMLETFVGFDVDVYVKEQGKKKKKTLRKITNILSPAIDIEGLGRNPTTNDILDHCIDRGLVYVSFNLELASVLVNFPLLDLPPQLFKLDIRHNPHALDLGYHLISLANQNRNKISILNALEACPDIPLQQFLYEKPLDKEETRETLFTISKQGLLKDTIRPYKHILEPLKKTLDALQDDTNAILKSYKLVDSKGKALKFEDITKNTLDSSYIIFELTDEAKPRTDEDLQKKISKIRKLN